MDIAVQLPKHYTTNAPIDTTTANEIETLKEKIKLLEAEKQVLIQVLGAKGQFRTKRLYLVKYKTK